MLSLCACVSQLGVIRGLWSLVVNDDDNKDTACREGAIEAIVGAMQTHPASSDLQGAACMVMWYVQYSSLLLPIYPSPVSYLLLCSPSSASYFGLLLAQCSFIIQRSICMALSQQTYRLPS